MDMTDKNGNVSVGMELRLLRTQKEASMREVAEFLGVSENFISLVERNKKIPSDDVIKQIAKYYMLDEGYLFGRFGKIPVEVSEEIRKHQQLHRILYDISTNDELNDEKKDKLFDDIAKLYVNTLKRED